MTKVQNEPYPQPLSDIKSAPQWLRDRAAPMNRFHPHFYEKTCLYTSTSAAGAVATGRTNTMGGSGDILGVDSGSTKDILAGSAVTHCKFWYINTNDQYEVKEVGTGGTSRESVDTSAKFYCDHWASQWGGLYDAEGAIIASGSGETFGTIAAGYNRTVSLTFHVAKYWRAMPVHLKVHSKGAQVSTTTLGGGISLYPKMTTSIEQDADINAYETLDTRYTGHLDTHEPWGSPVYGNDSTATKVEIYQSMHTTKAKTAGVYSIHVAWLMWCEGKTSSSYSTIQVS